MPSSRIAFAEIGSFTPAIDSRAVENGSIFVLSGRNYVFDVKGPKSGFGSTLVPGGVLDSNLHPVQSLDMGTRSIVMTSQGVYDRRWTFIDDESAERAVPFWNKLGALAIDAESNIGRFKWTSAYVGFGSFVCHPSYGIKQVLGDSIVPFSPDGLVESPYAIIEANGRLVILGRFQVQWSNASDPDDLTPELGGSGFQTSSELVPGNPLMLMSFQGGFVVYTDAGVLMFEYVGNEIVFRPDRIPTQQLLLNPNSCCEMPDGDMALLTQQGIYRASATNGMSELTPQFNAFLLDMMNESSDFSIRFDYILERDWLFVQVMDSSATFIKTFVLTMKMDKWGEFNENHRGIIRIAKEPGNFGWVDYDGYVHQFNDSPFVENSDGSLRGLESEIILGTIRPANGADHADQAFELQEIMVSARQTMTADWPLILEDWNGDDSFVSYNIGFYAHDIDYNGFGVDYYDINYNFPGEDEDWNDGPNEIVDWNETVAGIRDFDFNDSSSMDEDYNQTSSGGIDTDYIEDWGIIELLPAEPGPDDEDWQTEQSLFNQLSYGITINSNFDGYTELLTLQPSLAIAAPERDLWTGFTYGHEHTVKLTANQPWEKFHVKTFAITAHLAGQYS